jgi:hypothetical protein
MKIAVICTVLIAAALAGLGFLVIAGWAVASGRTASMGPTPGRSRLAPLG